MRKGRGEWIQNTGKFRRVCKFFIFWHSYTSNPELIAQCFRHFCSSCFWRPKPESEISGRGPLTLSNLCLVEYVCGEIENSQKTLFLRGQRLSTQKGDFTFTQTSWKKTASWNPRALGHNKFKHRKSFERYCTTTAYFTWLGQVILKHKTY